MISKINHTQISNDFIDNYMSQLTPYETIIFIAICRKTIGWHKNTDAISLSQIINITGLSKNTVIKYIKDLEDKNIILVERKKDGSNCYINKYTVNYSNKTSSPDAHSSAPDEPVESKTGAQGEHTKESIKETNTKESELLFYKFWSIYDKKIKVKDCLKKWLKLSKDDINLIFKHVYDYVKSKPDKTYRLNPLKYLNGECWNDEIIKTFEQEKQDDIKEKDKKYEDQLRSQNIY